MADHFIISFNHLCLCLERDQGYLFENKAFFKTLRNPVQTDQLHFIKNFKQKKWVPITERAISDFVALKHVELKNLTALVIEYTHHVKPKN